MHRNEFENGFCFVFYILNKEYNRQKIWVWVWLGMGVGGYGFGRVGGWMGVV